MDVRPEPLANGGLGGRRGAGPPGLSRDLSGGPSAPLRDIEPDYCWLGHLPELPGDRGDVEERHRRRGRLRRRPHRAACARVRRGRAGVREEHRARPDDEDRDEDHDEWLAPPTHRIGRRITASAMAAMSSSFQNPPDSSRIPRVGPRTFTGTTGGQAARQPPRRPAASFRRSWSNASTSPVVVTARPAINRVKSWSRMGMTTRGRRTRTASAASFGSIASRRPQRSFKPPLPRRTCPAAASAAAMTATDG